MFYTKYRPQTFSQISRPNEAADALATQVAAGKVAHAYLFVGPRGTGKTSTARILAKALNCSNLSKTGDPCDKCDMCIAVKSGTLPDLIEIDAASNRGIDDIRVLQDKISLAPSYGKHKVYIIDEVHMLTSQAFNALLKTLEEPPLNVTFILCTTELHKVPDTIKSRCQVFKFKRATLDQLTTKLLFIAESEGYKVDKDLVLRVAKSSLGGFRDAETLLQQYLEGGIENSSSSEITILSIIEFVNLLSVNDKAAALEKLNFIYDSGVDLSIWTQEIIMYLRSVLLVSSGFARDNLDISDEALKGFVSQVNTLSTHWLIFAIDKLSFALEKVKKSFIVQLPLEIAVIEICDSTITDSFNSKPTIKPNISPQKVVPSEKISTHRVTTVKDEKKIKGSLPEKDFNPETIDLNINISDITSKWDSFLNRMKEVNGSILAMLKSTKLVDIQGKFLLLDVYFSFHKERLEHSKNREIIDSVLFEVFNLPLSIMCNVSAEKPKKLQDREVGVLTDVNIVPVDTAELMNVFDGGLPL